MAEPSELPRLRALMAGLDRRQRERGRMLAQLRIAVERDLPADVLAGDAAAIEAIPAGPSAPPVPAPPRPRGWRHWRPWRRQN